jgi:hypothetical protein
MYISSRTPAQRVVDFFADGYKQLGGPKYLFLFRYSYCNALTAFNCLSPAVLRSGFPAANSSCARVFGIFGDLV